MDEKPNNPTQKHAVKIEQCTSQASFFFWRNQTFCLCQVSENRILSNDPKVVKNRTK